MPSAAQPAVNKDQINSRSLSTTPSRANREPKPDECYPTTNETTPMVSLPGSSPATSPITSTLARFPPLCRTRRRRSPTRMPRGRQRQVARCTCSRRVHYHQGLQVRRRVPPGLGRAPSGAIAVTYTWYNSATDQVLEQDIILSASLPWSYTQASNPDAVCGDPTPMTCKTSSPTRWATSLAWTTLRHGRSGLTMYGYGAKGELKKDTLGRVTFSDGGPLLIELYRITLTV